MSQDAVAVIAVHGVGGPLQGALPREIAGLLQRANGLVFSDFKESLLEIEVSKATSQSGTPLTAKEQDAPWFIHTRYAGMRAVENQQANQDGGANVAARADSEDIAFTREAVEGVEIDPELARYRSLKLSGTRRHAAGGTERVDIYEMYWADLSSLGGWIGRVLGEFYQILFHVANLGQSTLELAWLRTPKRDRVWLSWLLGAQSIAEGMLGGALPILNMALVLAVLPMLLAQVPNAFALATMCGILAGGFLAALLCAIDFGNKPTMDSDHAASTKRGKELTAVFFLSTMIGMLVGRWLYASGLGASKTFLFLALTSLAFGIYMAGVRALMRGRRPEYLPIKVVGALGGATWVGLVVVGLLRYDMDARGDEVRVAALVAEGLFFEVSVAWAVFMIAGWATCLFGYIASRHTNDPRTKAAIWTGRIGVFIPGTLFFTVNVFVWHYVGGWLAKMTDKISYESVFTHTPLDVFGQVSCLDTGYVGECIHKLIDMSDGPGFTVFMIAMFAAMIFVLTALLPSIIRESNPNVDSTPANSAAMGNWLDSGWVVLKAAGISALLGLLFFLPAIQLAEAIWGYKAVEGFFAKFGLEADLIDLLSGAVIGTAGVAVLFKDAFFKGITRALGIVFDVDNWLRDRPINKNPRGKILQRYMAVLRHVRSLGYRRVVIVSHSQGTVISADLLRFLHHYPEYVATLSNEPLSIRLMTFGSPLRQLYGLRFPDLYGWARTDPSPRPDPVIDARPERADLFSVERWVNCYRSGDYVGRFFWTQQQQWLPRTEPWPPGEAAELCLGAGAHTHYFDHSATEVGRVINAQMN